MGYISSVRTEDKATLKSDLSADAGGQMAGQNGATTATTFYAGAIEVISTTQLLTKTYYSAGGQLIAVREVTNTTGAGTLTYLHSDHLGSTSTTTCGNSTCGTIGAVLTRQSYYPYGTIRQTGNLPTDKTFTGHISDASTGLQYFNARYYSGALARFVSADTIVPGAGNPQALNRYMFVLGNPVKYTDPSGHDVDCGARDSACKKEVRREHFKRSTTKINLQVNDKLSGGLGTAIEGNRILTTKHYAKYEYFDSGIDALAINNKNFTGAVSIAYEFMGEDRKTGSDVLVMSMPGNFDLPSPARLANQEVLNSIHDGTRVEVVYWDNKAKELAVDEFVVQKQVLVKGTGLQWALYDPQKRFNYGDSGGGVYFNNYLVGNVSGIDPDFGNNGYFYFTPNPEWIR